MITDLEGMLFCVTRRGGFVNVTDETFFHMLNVLLDSREWTLPTQRLAHGIFLSYLFSRF